MGNRDKEVLSAISLSVSKAAGMLGIARQTLQAGVNSSSFDYIDGNRAAKLFESLRRSDDSRDQRRAAVLAAYFQNNVSIDIAQIAEAHGLGNIRDYYLILAAHPLELKNPESLQFMAKSVFTRSRVVAYFLGQGSQADDLADEIKLTLLRMPPQSLRARILVIKTNFVELVPHLAITRDEHGEWEGVLQDASSAADEVRLSPSYVVRAKRMLRFAGYRIEPDDLPMEFAPCSKLEFKGLLFETVYDTQTDQS